MVVVTVSINVVVHPSNFCQYYRYLFHLTHRCSYQSFFFNHTATPIYASQSHIPTTTYSLPTLSSGEWDDKEWDFGMYFPSNSQLGTLFKVIAKRNIIVDEERVALLKLRENADVNYETGLVFVE